MSSLYYQELGEGKTVILLHGLLGMSDNLGAIARKLAEQYRVIVPDAINHGHSPHAKNMSYLSMSKTIQDLMKSLQIEQAAVLGHSMGGKTAMQLANDIPNKVACLIVADIAPVAYPPREHIALFDAMKVVEKTAIQSRRDADTVLQEQGVTTLSVRQFLLKNLYKNEQEAWQWRCGLDNLIANYEAICAAPLLDQAYQGASLFIKGGKSEYVLPDAIPLIEQSFPLAEISTIEGAGHWLHAEYPDIFSQQVEQFLQKNYK